MQLALKVGKPGGTNFLSHILPSHFLHNNLQSTRTYNPIGSFQNYTTPGVLNTFNLLLKLIFYQSTYMTTISVKCAHGLSLGFLGSDVITSFST